MCLFTHFAAGALAGGLTGNPWLGLAAGVASHAVLDAIPHYDHPDWRLELGGGLLSLALLLVLPFASLPAVLGGLGGMLPDLENLFQKLGKMRRDQFIFPSHTGLVPHGRPLGPRSLVWQAAIFLASFGLLGLLAPGQAAAAATPDVAVFGQPVLRVLETGQDHTRILVEIPLQAAPRDWSQLTLERLRWTDPLHVDETSGPEPVLMAPRIHLNLAVPTRRPVKFAVSGVTWHREPEGAVPAGDLVEGGVPAVYRSVPLAGYEVKLGAEGGVLRSLVLDVSHPAQGRAAEQLRSFAEFKSSGRSDRWTEPVPAGLLNGELFSALARGGRELALKESAAGKAAEKGLYSHFDLTGNWVRLEVTGTGLHRLTGQELSGLGVATDDVDPAKLRLFQGGGLNLLANPEIPEADQPDRVGLTEVAIQVLDGGDGEWNLDDELRFYGFGGSCWRDRLAAGADPLDHFEHPYENAGVYWLTWASLAASSPLPGSPLRVAEVAAPATGGQLADQARRRLHVEQSNADASAVVADNWAWDTGVYSTRQGSFTVHNPVADSLATFVIGYRGNPPAGSSSTYVFTANGWLNGDTGAAASFSLSRSLQDTTTRVVVEGRSASLVDGANQFTLENASLTPRLPLALDSFDLLYRARLDLRDAEPVFEFLHGKDEVTAVGQAFDFRLTVDDAAATLVWDVSDPRAPRVLLGDLEAGSVQQVTLGVTRQPGQDLHLVAQGLPDLLAVSAAALAEPALLREQSVAVDYIVVYAGPFAQSALTLADYHSRELVGVGSPVAVAVSVDDIYANFSGGRKDVLAIRNYLQHVFAGGHRLRYVCFLGNASRDYRNYRGQVPFTDLVDFLPTELRTSFPQSPFVSYTYASYASDDGLTSFDAPTVSGDLDFPDLASGRLPATTVDEAAAMVEAAIDYQESTLAGGWRNRFLMASDDCNVPSHYPYPITGTELSHYQQAEVLANSKLPGTLDVQKIYGLEYAFPPGSLVKPQARADINAALNAGTTVFHYVGHGAEDNLADEQVFQSRDIANLTNGLKRPIFVAFSCDVGVYDNPIRRSMAELFLASRAGGAIGSICASQVSFIYANNSLSNEFYGSLYPAGRVVDNVSVATALALAKAQMGTMSERKNSQRYNLFGDPGLRLPNPLGDMTFAASSVDTLRAGARQVVTAQTGGAGALLGAGDSYDLRVEESAYEKFFTVYNVSYDYNYSPARVIYTATERSFVKLGAAIFRGNGTLDGDEVRVPFKVPAQLRYGDQASVRLVVSGVDGEHAAEEALPAVRASTGAVDDVLGPGIALSLPNRYRVRPGDALTAAFQDTSGIAILGTSPGNSILLEFDSTGFMTDVTESFTYDPNSYTAGRVVFPLSADIAAGRHTAAMHASDALGNVGSDTLSFTVAEYGVTGIHDVTVFPNPTPGPCRLVFDLTDAMQVQWDVYTLAGRRLKTIRAEFAAAGPGILEWDGRDDQGDQIANGTYLFVLRGRWQGDQGRELKETGKLVIMR